MKTMYVCVLDSAGQVLVHRNVAGLATPAIGVAIFAVAVFIWRRGILRYESAGS